MNRYALIGEKLSHSLSPALHEHILSEMGLEGSYELVELRPEELERGLRRLAESGFRGVNVTIPYKEAVLPFLDGISPKAKAIGAVNTLRFENGRLEGFNTDLDGFGVMMDAGGIRPTASTRCLVLGTGGAAKTAAHWLGERTGHVAFLSRNPEEAGKRMPGKRILDLRDREALAAMDLVVNCTPRGMYPRQDESALPEGLLKRDCMGADLVYNPMRTLFLQEREAAGARTTGGLTMLVAQALKAQEIWNGRRIEKPARAALMKRFQSDHLNLVLIGLPGSGKSSVGKRLARLTGREFVDTDALVEEKHGPIPRIFREKGEAVFREFEKAAAASLRNKRNLVIATGGGLVADPENVTNLKFNGRLVFLERSLEAIAATLETEQRPLMARRSDLDRLWKAREPLYRKAADVTVGDAGTPMEQARRILALLG